MYKGIPVTARHFAPDEYEHALDVNAQVTSVRQAAEWGMGAPSKVFRRLNMRLPFNPETRRLRLSNIFRLYNLRVRALGITQIGSVFGEFQ
jgi:hypothetical protein